MSVKPMFFPILILIWQLLCLVINRKQYCNSPVYSSGNFKYNRVSTAFREYPYHKRHVARGGRRQVLGGDKVGTTYLQARRQNLYSNEIKGVKGEKSEGVKLTGRLGAGGG